MRINSKKYKGLFITLIGVLFLLSLGITYAYFSLGVSGNNNATNMTATMGTLKITYEETNNIVATNIEPKWTASKTITVENTGTLPATYSLLWDNLVNEIIDGELLMSLSCTSDGVACADKNINVTLDTTNDVYTYTHSNNAVVPSSGSNKNIQTDFEIEAGETHTIVLNFYFKETNEVQDYNQGKVFSGALKVGDKVELPKLSNLILTDLIENPQVAINFNSLSSETNGKGLYKYNKDSSYGTMIDDPTGNGTHDIYYYRGNVTTNNVIFGNYCWLIVRTTDTGGTKIVYNGPVQEGEVKCPNYKTTNSDNPFIGKVAWEDTGTDLRYSTSNAKNILDNWTGLTSEMESKLEDIIWCNDTGGAQGVSQYNAQYPPYQRLHINPIKPQLECEYKADRYTVGIYDETSAFLTKKIAILTADEATLAGSVNAVIDSDADSYLNVLGHDWWLMTPSFNDSGFLLQFSMNGFFNFTLDYNWANTYRFIRPAVSLDKNVEISSGNGTTTDPYIVN